MTEVSASVSNNQASAQEALIAVVARSFGSSIWLHRRPTSVSTMTGEVVTSIALSAVAPALTDIAVRVQSATADNLSVTAHFDLVLLKS